ncbi:glycosyltransferase family 2 protein [Martelella limonii]|uniref:glycosyltransferase family 2 protein n=1 Tax=Martelella limonii TaxID=1647649 RepID=UPI001580931B|nr:glycosyltransferase family 2 protein [Martelella limonii]
MSILKQAAVQSFAQGETPARDLPETMRKERRMLCRLGFDEALIESALKAARANNTSIETELLSSGAVDQDVYYRRLAHYLVLPFEARLPEDWVVDRPSMDRLLSDPRGLRLDHGAAERRYGVVPSAHDLADLHIRLSSHPEIRRCVIITTPRAVRAAVWRAGARRRLFDTVNELMVWEPRFSSRIVFWGKQGFLLGGGAASFVTGLLFFPVETLLASHIIFTALYLFSLLVRLASARAASNTPTGSAITPHRDLPVYTLLIPLYREAGMIAQLRQSMEALNWPVSKLDIKLICEEDDRDTRAAIVNARLPAQFETVVVPPGGPRTKPNALNYALRGARGRYLVIYDAEDRPHPDQLREAFETFRRAPRQLACLQAPLTISNIGCNWITGLYACEYAGLFRGILPFLARHRFPVPLGGTSNHFRIEALRRCRAWDPYNVAEDADLGLRLHRLGYYCGAISLATLEDAPTGIGAWIAQRSRWIKGWLQTTLVALREPGRLRDEIGLLNFAVFLASTGGLILSALLHPLLFVSVVTTAWLMLQPAPDPGPIQQVLTGIDLINILASYWIFLRLGGSRMTKGELARMGASAVWLPVYWLMLSFAGWKAFLELYHAPYLWRKTDHRPSES